MRTYKERVADWMLACFGPEVTADKTERCFRFGEEALELTQSLGATREAMHALVDYVFGRKIGEPAQELGGVVVTLQALANAADLDVMACAQNEISRCEENIERIRAKHLSKPAGIRTSLPGVGSATERRD